MHQNSDLYIELFVNNYPLMDVRAPIEFLRGAFPSAQNLPIMSDDERETIGICYKNHGQEQAIQKGHELVCGKIRELRIAAWTRFANQNPNGYLYCFRGGLRSRITQQWMREAGAEIPIVEGGYKTMRTFLLSVLENSAKQCDFTLIGGKTGSAKTVLINELKNAVDLEGAAYHRGSSFGRHVKAQNNQINFENIIAIDFLKLRQQKISNLILEDEARTIGKVGIPKILFEKMRKSPLIVIEEPYEIRLERLLQEYVIDMLGEFGKEDPNTAMQSFANYLLTSLEKVQKRLGPVRFQDAHKSMLHALDVHLKYGDLSGHYDWLKIILDNYYDPMYEDQLKKRQELVIFRDNLQACRDYLENKSTNLI